ncbi:MAG: formate--tetrahydrofolate ligase [Caldilineaceae bacterium]
MSKPVPSDIEIAQAATLQPIEAIAEKMGLTRQDIEFYGDSMAKVKLEAIEKLQDRPNAKYVVVTAITPTPLGEGKSTTTVGLGQALHHVGKDGDHCHPPTLAGADLWHQRKRPAAATARSSPWSSLTCT